MAHLITGMRVASVFHNSSVIARAVVAREADAANWDNDWLPTIMADQVNKAVYRPDVSVRVQVFLTYSCPYCVDSWHEICCRVPGLQASLG